MSPLILSWNSISILISELCKKAARQLNVLKRIGKYLCKLGKLNIYYSFILSNFNFCPLTWHFCGETYTKKLEKIQERALRFIYEDYTSDYETLLSRSKLPSLKLRRMRIMALEVHKIIYKQGPTYLHDLVNVKESSFNFRYKNTANIPQVRTTSYGSNSFRSSAPKLWNSLPQHFRDEVNYERFRGLINAWSGESCSCSFCLWSLCTRFCCCVNLQIIFLSVVISSLLVHYEFVLSVAYKLNVLLNVKCAFECWSSMTIPILYIALSSCSCDHCQSGLVHIWYEGIRVLAYF